MSDQYNSFDENERDSRDSRSFRDRDTQPQSVNRADFDPYQDPAIPTQQAGDPYQTAGNVGQVDNPIIPEQGTSRTAPTSGDVQDNYTAQSPEDDPSVPAGMAGKAGNPQSTSHDSTDPIDQSGASSGSFNDPIDLSAGTSGSFNDPTGPMDRSSDPGQSRGRQKVVTDQNATDPYDDQGPIDQYGEGGGFDKGF